MEHIIFIRSDQSDAYYPNNSPFKFKVCLNEVLHLQGEWKLGILDFYIDQKVTKKNNHQLYLFCDVCSGVNVFPNIQYSLFRRIFPTDMSTWNYIFSFPIYLPVKKNEIQVLEFLIKDEHGENASFLKNNLSFTLQFIPSLF